MDGSQPTPRSRVALPRGPVFQPAAELGDVAMDPLCELARKEDSRHGTAVGQLHRPAIQARWSTRLDPRPDIIWHVIELAGHGDPTLRDLEHARMDVPDRVDPIAGRGHEF